MRPTTRVLDAANEQHEKAVDHTQETLVSILIPEPAEPSAHSASHSLEASDR